MGKSMNSLISQGCITVTGNNVIIRKVRVTCAGASGIYTGDSNTNLLVQDVEIDCGNAVGRTALTWRRYTAQRVHAHDCDNVLWAEQDVTIVDTYIHHPTDYNPVDAPHTDGVQTPDNAFNITITHNRIYGNWNSVTDFGNSAITVGNNVSNYLVEDNLLAGGGYTEYCAANQSGTHTNFRIRNNRFSTVFASTVGGFGPWQQPECNTEPTQVCGNVIHETGTLLSENTACPGGGHTNVRIVR
jgi:hypothetical protein